MGKLFHCEVEYLGSPHLMQIYTGFFKLQQQGVIDLKLKQRKFTGKEIPVIQATINHQYRVVYDTQDGMIWINDGWKENLEYFQKTYTDTDFYFKRSFHRQLYDYLPGGCQVFPLGFNYNIHPDKNLIAYAEGFPSKFKYFIKTHGILKKIFNKSFFYTHDFEYYPIRNQKDRILFLTRVWDPEGSDVLSEEDKIHRAYINTVRARCVEICQQEFGDRFTGGLWMDDYSSRHYPSLAIPFSKTNKFSFVKAVKEHNICIATTGLFNSVGWKMAEYVAASRAIISEPLQFEVPGNFEKGKNYFEFETADQLVEKIEFLLKNSDLLVQTMKNNYHYYQNYLKPDILVLNTLLTVVNRNQ